MFSISSIFFSQLNKLLLTTIFSQQRFFPKNDFSSNIKMAQLNALGIGVVNFYVQWPDDATRSLIQYRRAYQNDFATTSIHDQKPIWRQIAQNINVDHPNFAPSKKQCRNKWNALKSGYENLKRLLVGNPEGFPTRTPTLHDERFHEELSDEFWTAERNYLLLN
jgi:hypothetical protein